MLNTKYYIPKVVKFTLYGGIYLLLGFILYLIDFINIPVDIADNFFGQTIIESLYLSANYYELLFSSNYQLGNILILINFFLFITLPIVDILNGFSIVEDNIYNKSKSIIFVTKIFIIITLFILFKNYLGAGFYFIFFLDIISIIVYILTIKPIKLIKVNYNIYSISKYSIISILYFGFGSWLSSYAFKDVNNIPNLLGKALLLVNFIIFVSVYILDFMSWISINRTSLNKIKNIELTLNSILASVVISMCIVGLPSSFLYVAPLNILSIIVYKFIKKY